MDAAELARWACGGFFMTALVTGVWKYGHIRKSDQASAPVYVDIAHRASFMYAFSCLVLERFASLSRWSAESNFWGVAVSVAFFATALSTYLLHGLLKDTDNQLARPHKLGRGEIPGALVHGYMVALAVGEIGGFLVVFTGAMWAPA
jgi:hypothetical protein